MGKQQSAENAVPFKSDGLSIVVRIGIVAGIIGKETT
jgi:hypothetical protein